MKSIAAFLLKLRQMIDEEECKISPVVEWAYHGTAFVIYDIEEFSVRVLPHYFNLQKYKSFQRQLHYFGFRKWTKTTTTVCTYSHPEFQRDAIEQMSRIVRKKRSRNKRHQHPMPQRKNPPSTSERNQRLSSSDENLGLTLQDIDEIYDLLATLLE